MEAIKGLFASPAKKKRHSGDSEHLEEVLGVLAFTSSGQTKIRQFANTQFVTFDRT